MRLKSIATSLVHKVPPDLRMAIRSDAEALAVWAKITDIARNEWICWVESQKGLRQELGGSKGRGRISKRGSVDLVAGPAALIVETALSR